MARAYVEVVLEILVAESATADALFGESDTNPDEIGNAFVMRSCAGRARELARPPKNKE